MVAIYSRAQWRKLPSAEKEEKIREFLPGFSYNPSNGGAHRDDDDDPIPQTELLERLNSEIQRRAVLQKPPG